LFRLGLVGMPRYRCRGHFDWSPGFRNIYPC